jgi:hypothetical protein
VNTDFTNGEPPPATGATALDDSTMELDNIVFSGGQAGMPVLYSVNYSIAGTITLTTVGFPDVQAGVGLAYSSGTADNVSLGGLGVTTVYSLRTTPSGIFAGYDPTQPVINVSVSAPTPTVLGAYGSDTSIAFTLGTEASAQSYPGFSADIIVNFGDPFSLPTTGPVFNFFDPTTGAPLTGITANSSGGCIVNNAFMCGSVSRPGSVPELSTWIMMLAGFAALGFASYWRSMKGGTRQA